MHSVEEIPEVSRATSGNTARRDVDAEPMLLTLVAHVTEIREPQLVALPFHLRGYLSGQVGAGPCDLFRRFVRDGTEQALDRVVSRLQVQGPDGAQCRGARGHDEHLRIQFPANRRCM